MRFKCQGCGHQTNCELFDVIYSGKPLYLCVTCITATVDYNDPQDWLVNFWTEEVYKPAVQG